MQYFMYYFCFLVCRVSLGLPGCRGNQEPLERRDYLESGGWMETVDSKGKKYVFIQSTLHALIFTLL